MTSYRLPDWLGGHEVDILGVRGDGDRICRPRTDDIQNDERVEIHIHPDLLVEIKPPLPEEPPSGGAAATTYSVYVRCAKGWFDAFASDDPIRFKTWEWLNHEHPEIRPLAFDPVANAPELPYVLADESDDRITVSTGPGPFRRNCVDIGFNLHEDATDYCRYEPDEAELLGLAILRAARQAKEAK